MNTMVEEQRCNEDADCPSWQYCYVSKICADYVSCSRYNRLEADKSSRHPSQCGRCMKGFTSETLLSGEKATYCIKTITENSDNSVMIWIITSSVFLIILMCLLIVGWSWIKKRYFSKCKEECTEWNELKPVFRQNSSTIEASAPPEERNPTFKKGFKKGAYCLPYNNNTNVIDNNALVAARPFVAPNWVSNANFNIDDSDTDSTDAPDQNIVSQLPAAYNNPNTNNCQSVNCSEQLAVQPPHTELTMEYQDNARNTVLMQNYTLPSNDNANNADATSSTNSTNSTNDNRNRRDGTRTSNIKSIIKQSITMNVNVINGDNGC